MFVIFQLGFFSCCWDLLTKGQNSDIWPFELILYFCSACKGRAADKCINFSKSHQVLGSLHSNKPCPSLPMTQPTAQMCSFDMTEREKWRYNGQISGFLILSPDTKQALPSRMRRCWLLGGIKLETSICFEIV